MNYNIDSDHLCKHIEQKLNIKLPNIGFLAGQSLASAFYELNNIPVAPIYNDVDIYTNLGRIIRKNHHIANCKFNGNLVIENCNSYHGFNNFKLSKEKEFVVMNSFRKGIFNFIRIQNKVSIKDIVESFDLNCVKIGIDLKTKEVYLSQDFYDFLNHKEIEVTNLMTPFHTIIRFQKKIHELELKSDLFELNVHKVNMAIEHSASIDTQHNYFDVDINFLPIFGKKYFSLFETYAKNLSQHYFIILSTKNKHLFILEPKNNRNYLNLLPENEKILDYFPKMKNKNFSRIEQEIFARFNLLDILKHENIFQK